MTQRKPNPWFVRPSCTSAQPSHPLGEYAAKDLKFKRVAVLADDFAFGHENVAGFQRVFEDNGGKVVQKLFTPLNAPDYGTYISQLKPNLDAVYTGHAGSNGFKFIKQLREYGNKVQILGGFTPVDELLLQQMGDDALGAITGNWYSAELDFPINKRFVAAIQRDYKVDPGVYAAETYLCGEVLDHALKAIGGKIEDKPAFMKALQGGQGARHAARAGALRRARQRRRQQSTSARSRRRAASWSTPSSRPIRTSSQFWTYKQDEFLKNPVYSRDYPPARNLRASDRAGRGPPRDTELMQWQFWIIQTLNSVAFGGLLFMLSSGFSLIFGLMRIPNLAHGAFFMLGAYFGSIAAAAQAAFLAGGDRSRGLGVGLLGILIERFMLRGSPATSRARCW